MHALRIARATSDADLARVAAVRAALAQPWESGPNVEFLRHHLSISDELRYFVAYVGDVAVGCATAGAWAPGEPDDHADADASVLLEHRRRGIGTALLREASAHARALGRLGLRGEVREDDPASLAYVQKRSFVEVERQKAVVLELGELEAPVPETPPGVEIVSRAERDDLAEGMYAAGLEAGRDIPGLDADIEPTFEEWRAFELDRPSRDPSLCFVALVDGAVAGFASVDVIGGVGYNGLTAVRRAHRRRGIARALKLHQIAAAKAMELPRLLTESEERNEPMRRLNESLGYRPVPGSIVMQGPLLD